MPSPFAEREKQNIRAKLREAAETCLARFGVQKTTVDLLAKMAGIAKGSFYKFYPSKEELFFEVLEHYQNAAVEEIADRFRRMAPVTPDAFAAAMLELFQKTRRSFIVTLLENREFEVLFRKLPEDRVKRHHVFDDRMVENLFRHARLRKDVDAGMAAAALRAVFLTMLHVPEIGESRFEKALELLMFGLARQILEGDGSDA